MSPARVERERGWEVPAVEGEPAAPSDEPAPASRWRELAVRVALLTGCAVIVAAIALAIHLTKLEIPPVQAPVRALQPATAPVTALEPQPGVGGSASPVDRVDPAWARQVAAATGVPVRALLAYASADLTVDAEQPGCGIGWNTLAAIGAVESGHGTHGGATLGQDGHPSPPIRGIPLDGQREGVAAIADTDDGVWDGDVTWDRAVGPMQFIPSTWARWEADGNGDGVGDPNQIDDAALAAVHYLCASGNMTTPDGWRAAVLSYNRSDAYADQVAQIANGYASAAGTVP